MHAVGEDKEEIGYKTFLGHLYDLLEEKINTDRYEEGVRQLVGNQVRRDALLMPSLHPKLGIKDKGMMWLSSGGATVNNTAWHYGVLSTKYFGKAFLKAP